MTHGLQIKGEGGHVQIENTSCVLSVKQKGTLASGTLYSTFRGLFNPSSGEDLFLCPSAGSGKIGFGHAADDLICTTGSILYAVIMPIKNVTPSTEAYGLKTYDSVGKLIFDSGYEPPRPMGSVNIVKPASIPNHNDWYSPKTLSFPSPIANRKRYVNFSFFSRVHGWSWNNSSGQAVYTRVTFNSQSSITFGTELVQDSYSYNYLRTRSADIYGFVLEIT